MKKLFAWLLCICILCTPVLASGEASGDASDGAGPRSAAGTVAVTIRDGEAIKDDGIEVNVAEGGTISADAVSGASIDSTDNYAGGVAWYGGNDFLLGGEEDFHTVQTYYTGEELSFNTKLRFDLPDDYDWGSDSAGGFAIVSAGDGTMTVKNVYALSSGINRYTFDLSAGTNIVKDCYFESLGCKGEYCDMPWFTMQYGASRNIIMTSTANMYVYNSFCASDGYASWSTDMTSGRMYLYNADCVNYNGGYGSYADGCTVAIYGSTFDCGEYGLFDCNGGTLIVGSSEDARSASDAVFLANLEGEELAEDTPSVILGDRNAVAMHVVATGSAGDPEHNGIVDTNTSAMYNTQPHLYATNSVFSTVGATGTSLAKFPATIDMYLAHQKGSVFEFRSCNADVRLENCVLESASGVLFQSVIDLDGSAVQILDDIATEKISGICIESVGNDWTGDIAHEDYQRPMRLTLTDSSLTGAIVASGIDEWLSLWEGYEDLSYSVDPNTGLYVNDADPSDTCESYRIQDPDEIYEWATGVTEYDAVRGVYLTMDAASVWNVTGASNLRGLTVEAGAVINGAVTVDGVSVDVSGGGVWEGDIVVTPAEGGGTSADGASVGAAYVEYIREWLENELAHNDQMTQEQINTEYLPLIEAGDYTSFPVSYLYDGWLETGTAMTFEEFAAQYQPADGGVTWADYQAWIVSILPEICPYPDEVGEIILATNSWDEIDMDDGPWGKIFGEDAFNCTPWVEFQANGGVGAYNADFEDLPA